MPDQSHRLQLRSVLGRCLLVVAILGLTPMAMACQQQAATAQLGISVDQILADPERYIGRLVEANATIDRAVSDHVIVLQSQSPDQWLLAVLSNQAMQSLGTIEPGETVHLVGIVQPVTRQQIQEAEKQLGITLDVDQLLNLSNQAPFVIVQSATK